MCKAGKHRLVSKLEMEGNKNTQKTEIRGLFNFFSVRFSAPIVLSSEHKIIIRVSDPIYVV